MITVRNEATLGLFFIFILVSYVGERPWWPIQSLNNGRKKKAKGIWLDAGQQYCSVAKFYSDLGGQSKVNSRVK